MVLSVPFDPHAPVTPETIRDVSEAVYRLKIGKHIVKAMLAADAEVDPNDNGARLRRRAEGYDRTTRDYLEVLGYQVPQRTPLPPRKRVAGLDPGYAIVEATEPLGLFEA